MVCRNVQSSDLSAAGTKNKRHLQPGISLTLNQRWGVPLSSWISSRLTLHFPQRSDFNEICAVTQIKYCRHPVSIGLPRSSLKWNDHTALPRFSPNASLSLLAHPSLWMIKKIHLRVSLRVSGTAVLYSFLIFLATARYYRQQLLFNICCKQEVSEGMQSPSPFLGSSQPLLWATSMLLFIGCKVGCPGKPQSKWHREIIWRLSGRASCCLRPMSLSELSWHTIHLLCAQLFLVGILSLFWIRIKRWFSLHTPECHKDSSSVRIKNNTVPFVAVL